MVYTYLLRSKQEKSYYTGITKDISARLELHNRGQIISTAKELPWELVYTKKHESYKEARKHEKWLKKKNHEYKDKLAGQEEH